MARSNTGLIYLDKLKKKYLKDKDQKYLLNPIIGELDDPENQRQVIMTVPLTEEGNVAVYGVAGSGKTTFLTTMIYSLIDEHTPSELNLYILDFASETLKAFSKAPHVGDVLLSNDGEKIENLFKLLNNEIEVRRRLFSDYGGDYQSYIKNSNKEIETIVIVIHNYSAFTEIYNEKEENVAFLSREGLKYGIYFILTCLNTGAIKYRILQNFKQLYVLQLNDNSDYSGLLGSVDGVYPSKYKGRGIFKLGKVYEFQTAHISENVSNTSEFIKKYSNEYANKWALASAKKIPILPKKITINHFLDEYNCKENGKIPIGIEKNTLKTVYYDFENFYINIIMSQNNDSVGFVQGLSELLSLNENNDIIVLDPDAKYLDDNARKYKYINNIDNLESEIIELFNLIVYRNNTYKDAKELGKKIENFKKVTCIITSIVSLMNKLSEDAKDKLKTFLDKGETFYNINFIICESVNNISVINFDSWFKNKVSLSDGIWIGNGIANQYQFKILKVTQDMYKEINDDFGYELNKGKGKFIKLLTSTNVEMEEA